MEKGGGVDEWHGGGKKSPSPNQCREKFYSMRRANRKYLSEKKKKGKW